MNIFRRKRIDLPDVQLYSTNGEYGLKVLSEPQEANVEYEARHLILFESNVTSIVFVHGLTGKRDNTWTSRSGKFWPRDFLAVDIPKARIVTFGYDADVVCAIDVASSNTVRDHGKALATELARKRFLGDASDRPIIFVAHSLGGLALLISRDAAEPWMNTLLQSTAGIIFMGTPHSGSVHADMASILTNLSKIVRPTNTDIVRVLRPGSEMLASLQQQFQGMLETRQSRNEPVPRIYCFFEELAMGHVVGTIVPKNSAILPRYGSQGIHANHVDMTRFDDRMDQGYQDVCAQLQIWVKEAEGFRSAANTSQSARHGAPSWSGTVQSNGVVIQGNISSHNINITNRG